MIDHTEKLWDIVEDAKVCMLVDQFSGGMRARPMAAMPREDEGVIWFVTDEDDGKVFELARNREVCIAIQNGTDYVSITGEAEIIDDPAKLEEMWNIALSAWFPKGPKGGNARLLKVVPTLGEYWDGPSKIVAGIKMAIAAGRGERPDMGENAKVQF